MSRKRLEFPEPTSQHQHFLGQESYPFGPSLESLSSSSVRKAVRLKMPQFASRDVANVSWAMVTLSHRHGLGIFAFPQGLWGLELI